MQAELGLSHMDPNALERAYPSCLPIEPQFMLKRSGEQIAASTKKIAKNPIVLGMAVNVATDSLFPQIALAESNQARRVRYGIIVGGAAVAKEILDLNSDIRAGANTKHLAVNILQIVINGFAGTALGAIGTDVYDAFMATGKNVGKFFSDFNNVVNFGAVTGCTYAIVRTTKIFSMAIDKIMNPLRGQFEEMRQDKSKQEIAYQIGIAYLGTPEPHKGDRDRIRASLRANGIIDAKITQTGQIELQNSKGKWGNFLS
jgi:hypothetical protein